MLIREARKGDFQGLCSLFEQIDKLHRDNLPHIFQSTQGPIRQREYIQGLIAAQNVGVFVAEESGKLLGFVNVIVRTSSEIPVLVPRCFAVIETLVVDQQHSREGIGSALLEHAHNWAAEMGAETVELTVYEFNRSAREFYRRLGYRTESRRMSRRLGG